jgi:hypothetical protein
MSDPAARLSSLPFLRPPVSGWRTRSWATVVLYGVTVVLVALVTIGIEVGLGQPLVDARTPGTSHSLEDAVWHLTAGFVLALAVARRTALWLAPVLSLGLDADHIFGAILPTVTGRTSHSLLCIAAVSLILYALQGRTGALLAGGAVVGHIAVDGGTFPLLGPASTALYPVPLVVSAVLLVAVAATFVLAFRPSSELVRARTLSTIVISTAILLVAMQFLPTVSTFLGN